MSRIGWGTPLLWWFGKAMHLSTPFAMTLLAIGVLAQRSLLTGFGDQRVLSILAIASGGIAIGTLQ
jgi:hypothetical protein